MLQLTLRPEYKKMEEIIVEVDIVGLGFCLLHAS
jgi:hypothetical protein